MATKTDNKMLNKIQPIGDRVLVQRTEAPEKKSIAGIIIPDSAQKEKSKMGVVLAVGPGRVSNEGKLIANTVKVGAKVIFNAGWDNEVKVSDNEEEYFIIPQENILATV